MFPAPAWPARSPRSIPAAKKTSKASSIKPGGFYRGRIPLALFARRAAVAALAYLAGVRSEDPENDPALRELTRALYGEILPALERYGRSRVFLAGEERLFRKPLGAAAGRERSAASLASARFAARASRLCGARTPLLDRMLRLCRKWEAARRRRRG